MSDMNTGPYQPPQQPPSRWQRVCRRLRGVLAGVLGVFIVVTSSTIANVFTTSTNLPLSRLYVSYWISTYRVPLSCVTVGLLVLTIISLVGGRERKASPPFPTNQKTSVNIPLADNDKDIPTFGSSEWYNQQLNKEFDRMDD